MASTSSAMPIKDIAFLFSLLYLLSASSALITAGNAYQVGDSIWTIRGNKNFYQNWASDKKFHVGDTIVFKYKKNKHNVMLVSAKDYRKCESSNPKKVLKSGDDVIPMKNPGTYYYICGVSNHCSRGLKVIIHVT